MPRVRGWTIGASEAFPRACGGRPTSRAGSRWRFPARAGVDPRWTGSDGLKPRASGVRPDIIDQLPATRENSPHTGDQPIFPGSTTTSDTRKPRRPASAPA